jgi:hypothetical protein
VTRIVAAVLIAGALIVGLVVWALRPVCVALSDDTLRGFTVPIEQRTDRDFYLTVFQRRHRQWYQCKTWLSRQFFF